MNRFCEMGDDCEGQPGGEVRLLPYDGGDGNSIVCQTCYEHIMLDRLAEATELITSGKAGIGYTFPDFPTWTNLKVYNP